MPVRRSPKFDGWEPGAPVLEAVYESQVCVLKHTDLAEPETGLLASELMLRIKIFPEYVPELITLVVAEKFTGVDIQAAIGRSSINTDGSSKDYRTAYLDWTEINQTGRWSNTPSSTFLPVGTDRSVQLRLRVSGDSPPSSGLLYYFLKARKWHN